MPPSQAAGPSGVAPTQSPQTSPQGDAATSDMAADRAPSATCRRGGRVHIPASSGRHRERCQAVEVSPNDLRFEDSGEMWQRSWRHPPHLRPRPPGPTHLYTCTYQLPVGPLVLSVKESPDVPAVRTYVNAMRQRLGRTKPLAGLAGLGQD